MQGAGPGHPPPPPSRCSLRGTQRGPRRLRGWGGEGEPGTALPGPSLCEPGPPPRCVPGSAARRGAAGRSSARGEAARTPFRGWTPCGPFKGAGGSLRAAPHGAAAAARGSHVGGTWRQPIGPRPLPAAISCYWGEGQETSLKGHRTPEPRPPPGSVRSSWGGSAAAARRAVVAPLAWPSRAAAAPALHPRGWGGGCGPFK